jgi:hypothetical protein
VDEHGPFLTEAGAWSKLGELITLYPFTDVVRGMLSEYAVAELQDRWLRILSMTG